jgi:hypothetical protein
MKQLFLSLTIFFLAFGIKAQTHSTGKFSDVLKIKNGTLIAVSSGNDTIDIYFKEALRKYWTFTEISEFLPIDQAVSKARNDKSVFILSLALGGSIGSGHADYNWISGSKVLQITTGKNKWSGRPHAYTNFPAFGEKQDVTIESLFFAVASLNHICTTLVEDQVKGLITWNAVYNKYNHELEDITVYLNENWVADDCSLQEIRAVYPFPIKLVDELKWREAVTGKVDDVAYLMISAISQPGGYIPIHYFLVSGEPKILGTAYQSFNPSIQKFRTPDTNQPKYIYLDHFKLYNEMVVK